MADLEDLRQRARHTVGPLVIACVVTYLGYHAVQGQRGIMTWIQLGQQIGQAEGALALSRAEERRLSRRVGLVRPDGLDPDMLDERARVVLNLAHPRDFVVFTAGTNVTP